MKNMEIERMEVIWHQDGKISRNIIYKPVDLSRDIDDNKDSERTERRLENINA